MLLRRATLLLGIASAILGQGVCSDKTVGIAGPLASDWNGWSPASTNTRFQSAGAAGLTMAQVQKLKLRWSFGFEGDTMVFAQPSVIGNNLFVGSVSGKVHALDSRTGCTHWTFQAESAVRPSIAMVSVGAFHALLFGDRAGTFYSLDAESGRLLWKKEVDDHAGARVTGTAVVHQGVIYIPVASSEETLARRDQYACCTFRGSVVALRVEAGCMSAPATIIPSPPLQRATRLWRLILKLAASRGFGRPGPATS